MIYENISELICGDPLLHISRYAEKSAAAELFAKPDESSLSSDMFRE